jgi:large subunit ribosomal protein LP1
MAVFTFVVRFASRTWTAKQIGDQSDLEGSASNTSELQHKLTNLALTAASSGVVSSSFSFVTPISAVAQVS